MTPSPVDIRALCDHNRWEITLELTEACWSLMNSRIYLEATPISPASDSDPAAISAPVQKCLDAKGVDCEAWEKEMDERVAGLYGL